MPTQIEPWWIITHFTRKTPHKGYIGVRVINKSANNRIDVWEVPETSLPYEGYSSLNDAVEVDKYLDLWNR